MRSAMQGLLICLSACALASCSQSHTDPEVPDSETHFLASCESSCPADLACICGVCTAPCQRDADCTGLSSDATCQDPGEVAGDGCGSQAPAAMCDALCTEDADCLSIGPDHRCEAGACRPELVSAPPPPRAMCGIEDAPVLGPTESVAVATVLDDMRASEVVGFDGGAAFFAADGRLMILRAGRDEPETLRLPASTLGTRHIMSLAAHGQTIYWSSATPPPPATLPGADPPTPPSTIERMNADGSNYVLLAASDEQVYDALSADDENLYFTDGSERGLQVLANGGGEPELRSEEFQGSDIARSQNHVYWTRFGELKRADIETGEVETLLTAEQEPLLLDAQSVFANDDAIVLVIPDPKADEGTPDQTMARFDPDDGCLIAFDLPDNGITSQLLLQGDYVFWKGFRHGPLSPDDNDNSARLWRTDVATGETVQLDTAGLEVTITVDVLGQDADNIYMTRGTDLLRVSK